LAKFCYPKNYKDEATMWPWQLKDKFLCHDTLSDCNRQKDGWTDIWQQPTPGFEMCWAAKSDGVKWYTVTKIRCN